MKTLLYLAVCGSLLAGSVAHAAKDSLVTAVFSKVSNGYERQRMPDGSYKREYYALANGIYAPGAGHDRSIDAVRFPQIAKVVAQYLALQNYHLAQDARSADLLLVITWGTTVPFNDSIYRTNTDSFFSSANLLAGANAAVKASERAGEKQFALDGIQSPTRSVRDAAREAFEGQLYQWQMFDDARWVADEHNARLLGYVEEINRRNTPTQFAGAGDSYRDLISDIESERYYVIVAAYDFRAAAHEQKSRLLWTTRMSVQAQGNRFNETLAAMLARASHYFGRNSGRLVRQYEPNAKVTPGEIQFLGVVPDSELRDKPSAGQPK
jgi:hypothetical protein